MADQHRLRQILAGAFATLISLKLLLREVFFGMPLLQRRSCTIDLYEIGKAELPASQSGKN